MNKDEMKNRISLALKDPILQQGFEIICKNLVKLEKENAELKKQLEMSDKVYNDNLDYSYHIEGQLTKAKDIIKELVKGVRITFDHKGFITDVDAFVSKAEQFLKGSGKMKDEEMAEEWVKENMDCIKTVSFLNHDCNYFSDEERSIAKSAFKDGYNKAKEDVKHDLMMKLKDEGIVKVLKDSIFCNKKLSSQEQQEQCAMEFGEKLDECAKELEAQIEKMKCCEMCKHKNLNWEFSPICEARDKIKIENPFTCK